MLRFPLAGLVALACLALLPPGTSSAQPRDYEEGVHYQVLSHPLPDRDPERHEVIELFWYGCPVCYDLLPTSSIWATSYRSSDFNAFRLPVIWNGAMETHARIYLTAEELELLPELYASRSDWHVTPSIHDAVFAAIHEEGRTLRTAAEAYPLFEAQGVSREAFESAWHSEKVAAGLEELKALPGLAELPRLPALVLNGRYLISFNEAVTSTEELYKVLNYLVYHIREAERRAGP